MLPDCDMIDNSTGTPFPAFPTNGTQCIAMPPDMCTTWCLGNAAVASLTDSNLFRVTSRAIQ
jgi:hypothetical protein